MCGEIPAFPYAPLWRRAYLKHRDNFTQILWQNCRGLTSQDVSTCRH